VFAEDTLQVEDTKVFDTFVDGMILMCVMSFLESVPKDFFIVRQCDECCF